MRPVLVFFVLLLTGIAQPLVACCADYPFTFTDSLGQEVVLEEKPARVVSLVPAITEILQRIDAGERVVGATYHSPKMSGAAIEVVGGFVHPDMARVAALEPDIIFYAGLQQDDLALLDDGVAKVCLSADSLQSGMEHIRLLGEMFERQSEAEEVLKGEQRLLELISQKTSTIAEPERRRVVRLMGGDPVLVPGDDSFQNELIEAAGGLAPRWGKQGEAIEISLEEWQRFNPQFIYGCGDYHSLAKALQQKGWRDVDAVKAGNMRTYPCELTCRAATHTGSFAAWLSADMYQHDFSQVENQVLPERIVERTPLALELDYVANAELVASDIRDFRNKSVVLTFKKPMTVVSTLEGERTNVLHVGNHYYPPPAWGLRHEEGLSGLRDHTLAVFGLDADSTSFLFTGADMDNLSVVTRGYREMKVTVLVTAGVGGNAVRMAMDEGLYYEPDSVLLADKPGTINIIVLTNMQLSSRAMTRAIISATEAKTAALQDLDIRSSYSGLNNPATGTGTDNVLVVEGAGGWIENAGGHSRMGELIARAVYEGVQQAVAKQNGIAAQRTVFQRLAERGLDLHRLTAEQEDGARLAVELEQLLLDPLYSSFIESSFTLSDDFERGLVTDLRSFDLWCRSIATAIGGGEVVPQPVAGEDLPLVLRKAFGAVITGLRQKHSNLVVANEFCGSMRDYVEDCERYEMYP